MSQCAGILLLRAAPHIYQDHHLDIRKSRENKMKEGTGNVQRESGWVHTSEKVWLLSLRKKCGQCGIRLIKKQSTTKTSQREGLKQAVKNLKLYERSRKLTMNMLKVIFLLEACSTRE